MLSAAKFFTVLIFIVINFLILFTVKSRTTTITSLILAHLVAALFFGLSIASNDAFKELVLGLIIYSMVILFLISNYDYSSFSSAAANKINGWKGRIIFYIFAGSFFLAIFLTIFLVKRNLLPIANAIQEKKITLQNEIAANPMISTSHSAHIVVKKFYLGKGANLQNSDEINFELEANDRKIARLKDKLLDNFILKRSSDMILIIVAISSILLLLSQKINYKKNESL